MAIAITALSVTLEARTWTEAGTGRTVEGDYLESEGSVVVIKNAAGRTVRIPLARLSEGDREFIKGQSSAAAPAGANPGGVGSLAKLVPPASAKGLPVTGAGDKRESGIEVTNTGDRAIKGLVVQMLYLKADGSVAKTVPHTQGSLHGLAGDKLKKGQTYTIKVTSFFMEDDTAGVGAVISEITFDDDGIWPAPPATPPARSGEDPVAAAVIGVIGDGDQSRPAVACHNFDAKPVKSVQYRIGYLDAGGKVLGSTSYGYIGGDDPILPAGECIVISGGDGPPEGATDAKATLTRVEFADGSKWSPAK